MGLLDAPGFRPAPKEIILLAAGQSNMAGWTAVTGNDTGKVSPAEPGNSLIRVLSTGRGDNLVSQGDFMDGSSGWTLNGLTGSASGGVLTLTPTSASFPNMQRSVSGLTIGTTYELTAWIETITHAAQGRIGTASPTLVGGSRYTTAPMIGSGLFQAHSVRYTATATTHTIEVIVESASATLGAPALRIKDLQLREVLGSGSSYPVACEPMFNLIDFANIGALGPSPAYHIAQSLLDRRIASRVTVVPVAVGGTSLVSGPWEAPSGARYTDTVTKLTQALADNPLAVPVMLWIQGEADATNVRTRQQYMTSFRAMLAGFRGVSGAERMRCIIGSMVPEYIASSAAHARIDGAHQELAQSDWGTHYVRAPLGYQKAGEVFHFNAAGARAMAPGMAAVVGADWAR